LRFIISTPDKELKAPEPKPEKKKKELMKTKSLKSIRISS